VILLAIALAAQWKPPFCAGDSQAETDACARRDLSNAERSMAQQMTRIVRVLMRPERARTTAAAGPEAVHIISAEQRAWRGWRDAHCDVVAYGVQHTSAETMVRLDCKTEMTVKRTKDLIKVARN
jgi:uncharacterized protein YecT (DUF1311 family)